jgi:hypothetical protein
MEPSVTIDTSICANQQSMSSAHRGFTFELKFLDQQERGWGLNSYAISGWLAEAREMRGRVLYDDGRRPFFRMNDGSFGDPDPVDVEAYHVIARSEGHIVGYARIVPPTSLSTGFIASTIGKCRFEAILHELSTDRERICEASRWAVVPECRGSLGSQIVVASWIAARRPSYDKALVLACTCRKQDAALIRMGAHAVSSLPLFASECSDEQLRLLYFDLAHASEFMEKKIAEKTNAFGD